ncbi:DUF6875 domain-containing protein [Streptomyces sp. SID2119]|uniref:DUF6875 domain-containing protein n=1 Tax=Streptomyces sp. SID2119 TaxID=2690253 RepID=UPI00136E1CD9|nr:hypothetical protein [Streptomyces sp. SID2119]MYW32202.1 hypothetical protein [Streptomyces sp. SID2119]
MSSAPPDPGIEASLASVDAWLTDYIAMNHPEIGRVGPICPFVTPSRKNDSMEIRIRLLGFSPTAELVEEVARSGLREYELTTWQGRNPMLRAMVIVLPDLRSEDTPLLDRAQEQVKDAFVSRGLMIGQFHRNCDVTAARNPRFAVSRAPVPVFAIRSIALHDIFFLAERRHWFEKYRERFGMYFGAQVAAMDPLLVDCYRSAEKEFGYAS